MAKNYWNVKALAIALGIFMGAYLFLAALLEMAGIGFWWFNSTTFGMLTAFYPWIAATFTGALIGLVIGFICGVICGAIIAWLYNFSLKKWC